MLPFSCALGAPGTTRRSAWICRATAILALVMFIAAMTAPVARAHDVLVASSPSDGEHLDAAPTTVRLEFNNELLDLGSNAAAVVLTDATNEQIATGPLTISGREATYELPALSDGAYSAAWSVVSSDGHRIQGTISFTVGDAEAMPTDTDTSATPEPSTTDEQTVTDGDQDQSPSGLPRIALPIFGIGILATMVMIILRLKRT